MRYLLGIIVLMSSVSVGAMELGRIKQESEILKTNIFDETTWDETTLPCECKPKKPVLPGVGNPGEGYYYEELPEAPLPLYILYLFSGAILSPVLEPLYKLWHAL